MKEFKANVILGKKQLVLASLVLILGAAVYLNWQFASKNNELTITSALTEGEQAGAIGENVSDDPLEVVVDEQIPVDYPADDTGAVISDDLRLTGTSDTQEEQTAATDSEIEDANANANADTDTEDTTNKVKNLGDALLVNGGVAGIITAKNIVDENYFATARLMRTKARDESVETMSMVLNGKELSEEDKKAVSEKAIALTDIIEAEARIENLIKSKGFEECMVYITEQSANVVVKCDGLDQDQATQIKNIIVSEGKISGENVAITEIN